MGFEVLWRSILIKLLHFKLITLAIYLDEEVNIWNEVAVCGDVGPLQSNTDASAVILSSASASVFMWLTMQGQGNWLQIESITDLNIFSSIFSIDMLESQFSLL